MQRSTACCVLQEGESELEEVEKELSHGGAGKDAARKSSPAMRILYTLFSQVFLKAFTLTFLAEWGDRSQIATIG